MARIYTDPSKGIWGGWTDITQKPVSMPAIGGGIAPEAETSLQKAMAYYQPGGAYGAGVEAALGRGRTKAMATGMQSLVSAGLAGTTMAAGLGKKFEEEVGMPIRAGVEEARGQAISGLHALRAQIIQGATESARATALQTYLARLQASQQGYQSEIQAALAGQIRPGAGAGAPTGEWATQEGRAGGGYEFPRAPSLTTAGGAGGVGGIGGGVDIPTQLLEPATPDMYTTLEGRGGGLGGIAEQFLTEPSAAQQLGGGLAATVPAAQQFTYKEYTDVRGRQLMGVYRGGRRVGSETMEQYAARGK